MSYVWYQSSTTLHVVFTVNKSEQIQLKTTQNSLHCSLLDCSLANTTKGGNVSEAEVPFTDNKVVVASFDKIVPAHWDTLGTGAKQQDKIIFRMTATSDYKAEEVGELTIKVGDVVFVTHEDASGWFTGYCHGVSGIFPSNFAEKIEEAQPSLTASSSGSGSGGGGLKKQCKASFDYEKQEDNELGFKTGDIITVLSEDDSGWWTGELNGLSGMFPSNFVEVIAQPAATTLSANAAIAAAALAKRGQLNKVSPKSQTLSGPINPAQPQTNPFQKQLRSPPGGRPNQPNQPSGPVPIRPSQSGPVGGAGGSTMPKQQPQQGQPQGRTTPAVAGNVPPQSHPPRQKLVSPDSPAEQNVSPNPENWLSSLPDYDAFCQQLASILSSTRAEGQPSSSFIQPVSSPSVAFACLDGRIFVTPNDSFAPLAECAAIPLATVIVDHGNSDPFSKISFPSGSVEQFAALCSLIGNKSPFEHCDEVSDKLSPLSGYSSGVVPAQYAKNKNDDEIGGRILVLGAKNQLPDSSSPNNTAKLHSLLSSLSGSTKQCAVIAATIANDGTNPCTNEKALPPNVIRLVLQHLFSPILKESKLPILTTRSGYVLLPIPKVGGIAIYAPALLAPSGANIVKEFPPYSNKSAQGLSAAEEIVKRFKF